MVPFIDVMLVLLIIFMVTAPLITTGVVDLPTVGKSQKRPDHVIELIVASDERHPAARSTARMPGRPRSRELAARVRSAQNGNDATPVVISADKAVKYEIVVKVMDTLQRAGVQRVGLSVKTAGG